MSRSWGSYTGAGISAGSYQNRWRKIRGIRSPMMLQWDVVALTHKASIYNLLIPKPSAGAVDRELDLSSAISPILPGRPKFLSMHRYFRLPSREPDGAAAGI